MDKNTIIVYICGQRFPIVTGESEDYLTQLAKKTETKINSIQANNPKLNRDSCAILASLDYCDEKAKLKQDTDNLREQIKDYLLESEKLRRNVEELKRENQRLKEMQKRFSAEEIQRQKREINQGKTLIQGGRLNQSPKAEQEVDTFNWQAEKAPLFTNETESKIPKNNNKKKK